MCVCCCCVCSALLEEVAAGVFVGGSRAYHALQGSVEPMKNTVYIRGIGPHFKYYSSYDEKAFDNKDADDFANDPDGVVSGLLDGITDVIQGTGIGAVVLFARPIM
jgi:hypothetical protein